jgi:MFS family permease
MYLMMPLTFTLLTRYPRIRRFTGPIGLVITVSSLILSSFATKVWHLIFSQGVMCAIGSGLLFSPTTLYLDEWFNSRKGMAYGVM